LILAIPNYSRGCKVPFTQISRYRHSKI